jgi:hypothetical protein
MPCYPQAGEDFLLARSALDGSQDFLLLSELPPAE